MIPASFNYQRVSSLAEAVAVLQQLGPDAKLIAGGQSLLPLLKLRMLQPSHLVDIGRVAGAGEIFTSNDELVIGALATHASIGHSPATQSFAIVRDCALGIADAQVRSMGTIGGSLAGADPNTCWSPMLVALDASVQCVGPAGTRTLPVRKLLRDAYSPDLAACELIESVHIKLSALAGHGAFVAFKRSAGAYPTMSVALQVSFDGERVAVAALALGCQGGPPITVQLAHEQLAGRALDGKTVTRLRDLAAAAADPIADNRGSKEYKRDLAMGLVRRACSIVEARRNGSPADPTHTYYG